MPVTFHLGPMPEEHKCPMCDPVVRGLHKLTKQFVGRFKHEQEKGGDFEASTPEGAEALNQYLWELEQWLAESDKLLLAHYKAVPFADKDQTVGTLAGKIIKKSKLKYTNHEAYLMLADVADSLMTKQKHAWDYLAEVKELKAQGMKGLDLIHAPELAHYKIPGAGFAQGIVQTAHHALQLIDHIVEQEKMLTPTGKVKA